MSRFRAGTVAQDVMRFVLLWSIWWVGVVLLPYPAAGDPPKDEDVASRPYADRLLALKPSEPEAYFKLAEEVADKAEDSGTRRLAIRLYVLAYELDRQRGGVPALAASSCLGLIPVASGERDRRWLSAVARLLDARHASLQWIDLDRPAEPESAYYRAATLLGQIRAGQGMAARQLMQDPQVSAVLERFDRTMVRLGVQGGVRGLEREAEQWPCKECNNERVVRKGNRGQEARLCSNCKGTPGPALDANGFLSHLRMESLLLQGSQRSWAAQMSVDDGAPLIDPDPDAVADVFNVDTTRTLYRDGAWVIDPNAPAKTKKLGTTAAKSATNDASSNKKPDRTKTTVGN